MLICLWRFGHLHSSWKDPAERIMSILNIGLQATGLMRDKINDPALEHRLKSANNMKEIRELAKDHDGLKDCVKNSVRPVKQLLEDIFSQLKLEDKPFITFESAKDEEIDTMWKEILKADQTLTTSDTTKLKISTKEQFKSFLVSHSSLSTTLHVFHQKVRRPGMYGV